MLHAGAKQRAWELMAKTEPHSTVDSCFHIFNHHSEDITANMHEASLSFFTCKMQSHVYSNMEEICLLLFFWHFSNGYLHSALFVERICGVLMEYCHADIPHIIWGVLISRGLLYCTLAFLISGQSGDFQSALLHRSAHKLSAPRIQSPIGFSISIIRPSPCFFPLLTLFQQL